MFDGIEAEIESGLSRFIESGDVRVLGDPQPWFDRLSDAYPIGLNRIDWEKVVDKVSCDIIPFRTVVTDEELQAALGEHRGIVASWFQSQGIAELTKVVWFGDSSEITLEMTLCVFLECFSFLLSWPQHCYLVPRNLSWCLSYTMEGQLFFGRGEIT